MMSHRPVIGVPTQTLQAIDGIPPGVPHSWVMNHRYFLALTGVGAVPWMVPLLDSDPETIRAIYDRLDGVFLAGGVDLDPTSYGRERDERCGNTDISRDRVELMLAKWALDEGKPLFGVCRGMQVINVASGGTLFQDCSHIGGSDKHDYFPTEGWARDYLAHEIEVTAGSRLAKIFGSSRVLVNSMHHQAIDDLGSALTVTAIAPDGVIEAVEGDSDAFMIGVQWHPEMLVDRDPGTHRLFEAFIEAASEYGKARLMASV
jgi:putative glutamine amidotransferase